MPGVRLSLQLYGADLVLSVWHRSGGSGSAHHRCEGRGWRPCRGRQRTSGAWGGPGRRWQLAAAPTPRRTTAGGLGPGPSLTAYRSQPRATASGGVEHGGGGYIRSIRGRWSRRPAPAVGMGGGIPEAADTWPWQFCAVVGRSVDSSDIGRGAACSSARPLGRWRKPAAPRRRGWLHHCWRRRTTRGAAAGPCPASRGDGGASLACGGGHPALRGAG
jgi:hypothetical protein